MSPADLASTVAAELLERGAQAVVLTGSHARGDGLPESDIDIVALGNGVEYQLERRAGQLLSVSWVEADAVRRSFTAPGEAAGVVPGWRAAVVLADPNGAAEMLKREALAWNWDVVGACACNAYVAEEVTGLAEEVHKLVNLYATGNLTGAAVLRALLSFRMGAILAVHLRLLYETENNLWELVNEGLGEPWKSVQACAFGLGDESFAVTCRAALTLYRLAAESTLPLMNERQAAVVQHACELSLAWAGGRGG